MVRKSIEQRIAELEARKKPLVARMRKQDRARDTRRKILLGALVLDRMKSERDPAFAKRLAEWLRRELPGFLTRDIDRDLFKDLCDSPPAKPYAGSICIKVRDAT